MTRVTIAEARDQLPQLLGTATSGESVFISGDDGQLFRLVPAGSATGPVGSPQAGSCRGLIELADDFDEPLEELREYME